MKAITLWEPWASAMALGKKANETRSWPTAYRCDLAICAAKRPIDDFDWNLVELLGVDIPTWQPSYGCVLAVVELYGCLSTYGLVAQGLVGGIEFLLGDYSPGRFAWLTRNLRRLKTPVPVVGRQGLFNLPPGVESAVMARI